MLLTPYISYKLGFEDSCAMCPVLNQVLHSGYRTRRRLGSSLKFLQVRLNWMSKYILLLLLVSLCAAQVRNVSDTPVLEPSYGGNHGTSDTNDSPHLSPPSNGNHLKITELPASSIYTSESHNNIYRRATNDPTDPTSPNFRPLSLNQLRSLKDTILKKSAEGPGLNAQLASIGTSVLNNITPGHRDRLNDYYETQYTHAKSLVDTARTRYADVVIASARERFGPSIVESLILSFEKDLVWPEDVFGREPLTLHIQLEGVRSERALVAAAEHAMLRVDPPGPGRSSVGPENAIKSIRDAVTSARILQSTRRLGKERFGVKVVQIVNHDYLPKV